MEGMVIQTALYIYMYVCIYIYIYISHKEQMLKPYCHHARNIGYI